MEKKTVPPSVLMRTVAVLTRPLLFKRFYEGNFD